MSIASDVIVKYSDIQKYSFPNFAKDCSIDDPNGLTDIELASQIGIINRPDFTADLERGTEVVLLKVGSMQIVKRHFERLVNDNDKLMFIALSILAVDFLAVISLSLTDASKVVHNVATVAIIAVAVVFAGVLGYAFKNKAAIIDQQGAMDKEIDYHYSNQSHLIQNKIALALSNENTHRVLKQKNIYHSAALLESLGALA